MWPIHDRATYENALEIVEAMAGFEEDFNGDQTDDFVVIGDFGGAFEDAQRAGQDSNPRSPLEALKYFLKEME